MKILLNNINIKIIIFILINNILIINKLKIYREK